MSKEITNDEIVNLGSRNIMARLGLVASVAFAAPVLLTMSGSVNAAGKIDGKGKSDGKGKDRGKSDNAGKGSGATNGEGHDKSKGKSERKDKGKRNGGWGTTSEPADNTTPEPDSTADTGITDTSADKYFTRFILTVSQSVKALQQPAALFY